MAQDSRISTKALLVGVAVDLVGSSLFGAVVGFCWAIVNARQGAAPMEWSFFSSDPWVLLTILLIGLCYTAIGGYVAAIVAKRSPLLHGALVGGLTLPWFLLGIPTLPFWYNVASLLGVIPFGLLGGMFARWRQRASSAN